MDDMLARLREATGSLKGIDKVLADDLISDYATLVEQLAKLGNKVKQDGVMIEKEVGTVNNRHMEMVENPAFTTYCKALGRKSDLAKKISAFVKHDETPEGSSIGAFVAQRPVPRRAR